MPSRPTSPLLLLALAGCYGSQASADGPCEGGPLVCFGGGVPTAEQCAAVCSLREGCHGWEPGERAVCEAACRPDDSLGFAACVEGVARSGECDQADACFGDLVEPAEGYCHDACAFEHAPCGLIEAAEIEVCVDFCEGGGQTTSLYECRQEALGSASCEAYLECASSR